MLIKTRGVVFRSVKYSETSIIADIFTESKGLRTYIISGVRKQKSRVSAGLLQVMSLVEMVAYHRDDRDLHRIKEIKPAHVYRTIPFEVRRGAIGLFMAEVASKSILESETNQALFEFLYQSFTFLDSTTQPVGNLHLYFMLGLTGYLGFLPGGSATERTPVFNLEEGIFVSEADAVSIYTVSPSISVHISNLLHQSMERSHELKIDRKTRQVLLKHLLDYYRLHIDNFQTINAHMILQEVLD